MKNRARNRQNDEMSVTVGGWTLEVTKKRGLLSYPAYCTER